MEPPNLLLHFGWAVKHFEGDSHHSEDDFSVPIVINM